MKKSNIYLIILIFCFVKNIVMVNIPQFSDYIYILGDILLIILLAIMLKNFKINKSDFCAIMCLTIAQLIGTVYNDYTEIKNKYIYKYLEFILGYLTMYICVKDIHIEKKEVNKLYKIILVTSIISTLYAMVFQLGKEVFAMSDTHNFTMVNVYKSFWGHRNHYALVLLSGIISSVYFFLENVHKKFMVVLLIIFTANLFLTFSRTCYLALIVFIIIYYLLGCRKNKNIQLLTIIIAIISIVISIVIYLNVPEIKTFVDSYVIRQKSGLTGRDTIWNNAISMIDLPTLLFGRGFGVERVILQDDTVGASTGLHNMYLTYVINGGIILLAFIGSIIYNVIKKINIKIKSNQMKSFFIASMVAFLTYAFFEVTYFFGVGLQAGLLTYFCIILPVLYINSCDKG